MAKSGLKKTLIVTGAAGFIGSQFIRILDKNRYDVVIVDALTYAGRLINIESELNQNCVFEKGLIQDEKFVSNLFLKYQPDGIINFAAESHVDNSILGPKIFIETNILGTFTLLECARKFTSDIPENERDKFRFLHVSTDEVFGELDKLDSKFNETTNYAPNSPYSASKAASDLLARAWNKTYSLPVIITNCSNNYGPRQFPEKLIPRIIVSALAGKELPVYGLGENIRDWIHVEDHCRGVLLAYENGIVGQSYCFGGNSERRNIDVVNSICKQLDRIKPRKTGSYLEQIRFVTDRLGHDFRYAIDDSKAIKELNFVRRFNSFEEGLESTIHWYLNNELWLNSIKMSDSSST